MCCATERAGSCFAAKFTAVIAAAIAATVSPPATAATVMARALSIAATVVRVLHAVQVAWALERPRINGLFTFFRDEFDSKNKEYGIRG